MSRNLVSSESSRSLESCRLGPSIDPRFPQRRTISLHGLRSSRAVLFSQFFAIEAVCGNQTAPKFQRVGESWLYGRRFRSGIDGTAGNRWVLCPGRNEPPSGKRQFPVVVARTLANDGNRLCGSDVVTRIPILLPAFGSEIFLNNLLFPGKAITAAHGRQTLCQIASSAFPPTRKELSAIVSPTRTK